MHRAQCAAQRELVGDQSAARASRNSAFSCAGFARPCRGLHRSDRRRTRIPFLCRREIARPVRDSARRLRERCCFSSSGSETCASPCSLDQVVDVAVEVGDVPQLFEQRLRGLAVDRACANVDDQCADLDRAGGAADPATARRRLSAADQSPRTQLAACFGSPDFLATSSKNCATAGSSVSRPAS